MSILPHFRALFTRKPGLRNKPHQMAWIVGLRRIDAPLNGRAVKTVSFTDGYWLIDPPQKVERDAWHRDAMGNISPPGIYEVVGLFDKNLEPWKEDGITQDEVTALYAPKAKETA